MWTCFKTLDLKNSMAYLHIWILPYPPTLQYLFNKYIYNEWVSEYVCVCVCVYTQFDFTIHLWSKEA